VRHAATAPDVAVGIAVGYNIANVGPAGAPLVGVTFSMAGHGRVGFAAIAALWAMSAVAMLPSRLSWAGARAAA
jgi:hypothetical protein